LKYYELLKTTEKPLHPGTKHSKLSATVHMYNWKCVEGISNKIFSDILELMNQLLPPCDETLPGNRYEVKKFLSDMGLGYEKIPACRNDCMLFWKCNKDLDSCIVCGESKWKDDNHLDDDGEPISSRKKTSSESVVVVSTHPTATETFHVGAYYAVYMVACRRPH